MMSAGEGNPQKNTLAKKNIILAFLLFSIRLFFWLFQVLFVVIIVAPFLFVTFIFLYILTDSVVWLFDLIFRLNYRLALQEWIGSRTRPFFESLTDQIGQWSETLGLAFLLTEVVRGLVLFL